MREAKQAEMKQQILNLRRLLVNGGLCETSDDADALIHRLQRDKDSVLPEALKDQIRYQKTILGSKGTLRLSGSLEDLILALKGHLGDPALPVEPQPQLPELQSEDEESDGNNDEFDPIEPPEKQACPGEAAGDEDDDEDLFSFGRQGQWVAVFCDDQFYIGQVIEKTDGQSAAVKYLEPTKGRKGYYRWPRSEGVAETSAHYVYLSLIHI